MTSMVEGWSPRGFSDVVGQDLIVATLRGRLRGSEKLDNHLAFAGPRGVGKRTLALLYAQSLVCDGRLVDGSPCQACAECQAIRRGSSFAYVEVNAETKGDDETVRILLERDAHLNTANVRVVVINNAELLTVPGADVALKTLERETKSVFLFLVNDLRAFSGALRSRCHVFRLRPADEAYLVDHLANVCSQSGISYARSALKIIARSAKGLCGAAIDMLMTVAARGEVVASRTLEALCLAWVPAMRRCWQAAFAGKYEEALSEFGSLGTNSSQRIRAMQAFILELELRSNSETLDHTPHPALAVLGEDEWATIAGDWERAAISRNTDSSSLIRELSKYWCSIGVDAPSTIAFNKAWEALDKIHGESLDRKYH
jgi:DNA polymerase III delta prime subunit